MRGCSKKIRWGWCEIFFLRFGGRREIAPKAPPFLHTYTHTHKHTCLYIYSVWKQLKNRTLIILKEKIIRVIKKAASRLTTQTARVPPGPRPDQCSGVFHSFFFFFSFAFFLFLLFFFFCPNFLGLCFPSVFVMCQVFNFWFCPSFPLFFPSCFMLNARLFFSVFQFATHT